MRNFKRVAYAASTGLIALGLTFGTTALPASAKGSKPAKIKVSPKSKLINDDEVTVTGSHFTPGDTVYVIQCVTADMSTTGSGCDIPHVVGPVTVNSDGTLPATLYVVHTGAIGSDGGTCGTSKADAKACDISVGNVSATDTAHESISFTVPKG
jgi:hypothetical protein